MSMGDRKQPPGKELQRRRYSPIRTRTIGIEILREAPSFAESKMGQLLENRAAVNYFSQRMRALGDW
jgi:hypothetical protein